MADDTERLLELADQAHEACVTLWSVDNEPRWWIDLGKLLDRMKPTNFYRNSGDTREGF
jgi:hypothetical protein